MENNMEKTSLALAYVGLKNVLQKELKVMSIKGFGVKPMEYHCFNTLVVFTNRGLHHCIINDSGVRLSEWKEEKQNDKIVKNS